MIAAMYASRSWRVTAPLRGASIAARWFVRGSWAWLTLRPGSRPHRVTARLKKMLSAAQILQMRIPASESPAQSDRITAVPVDLRVQSATGLAKPAPGHAPPQPDHEMDRTIWEQAAFVRLKTRIENRRSVATG